MNRRDSGPDLGQAPGVAGGDFERAGEAFPEFDRLVGVEAENQEALLVVQRFEPEADHRVGLHHAMKLARQARILE